MVDNKKMVEITKTLLEQAKSQVNENIKTKKFLIEQLKILINGMPDNPFYDKYKAIIAKTMIDIQYLT